MKRWRYLAFSIMLICGVVGFIDGVISGNWILIVTSFALVVFSAYLFYAYRK